MARHESDREDLLRDATAFAQRVLLKIPHGTQTVFAGFRKGGGVSIYFGSDPVYHFNQAGELRRAYCESKLLKAERGALAMLDRQRPGGQVLLVRHDLTAAETEKFKRQALSDLQSLHHALLNGQAQVLGRVPQDTDLIQRLTDWLSGLPRMIIARSPHTSPTRQRG
jgi:hypothetical protein